MTTKEPPAEASDAPVEVTVAIDQETYARMKKKAFGDEEILQSIAADWLGQAAAERFRRDADADLIGDDSEDKYPSSHFHTDEFVEGFYEAFLAWRDLKNALALVLASFANGRSRRGEESERIACAETFKDMMLMFRALTTKKKHRRLLSRCHEANRQWLCIEAGHGDPDITAGGFKSLCDELCLELYALV